MTMRHARPALPSPSPGAARMRRYRERVKAGAVVVRFDLSARGIDRLIALRWLNPDDRSDTTAVVNAFIEFATHILRPDR